MSMNKAVLFHSRYDRTSCSVLQALADRQLTNYVTLVCVDSPAVQSQLPPFINAFPCLFTPDRNLIPSNDLIPFFDRLRQHAVALQQQPQQQQQYLQQPQQQQQYLQLQQQQQQQQFRQQMQLQLQPPQQQQQQQQQHFLQQQPPPQYLQQPQQQPQQQQQQQAWPQPGSANDGEGGWGMSDATTSVLYSYLDNAKGVDMAPISGGCTDVKALAGSYVTTVDGSDQFPTLTSATDGGNAWLQQQQQQQPQQQRLVYEPLPLPPPPGGGCVPGRGCAPSRMNGSDTMDVAQVIGTMDMKTQTKNQHSMDQLLAMREQAAMQFLQHPPQQQALPPPQGQQQLRYS
jgi:hypothetical protein